MEKKIPFASDVILIDAAFLDRVGGDMAAHFAPLVGRELPKADLAVLLECLALDAGLEPGQHEIQVIFVYDVAHDRMNFCTPSDLEKEIHGMAFQSRLGEFSLYAFQTSGMARREDLFCESLQLLMESKDARRVMLVPDEGEYGCAAAPRFRQNKKQGSPRNGAISSRCIANYRPGAGTPRICSLCSQNWERKTPVKF
mgnify:CR=1 FL=1